jgi:hypothetical protein
MMGILHVTCGTKVSLAATARRREPRLGSLDVRPTLGHDDG